VARRVDPPQGGGRSKEEDEGVGLGPSSDGDREIDLQFTSVIAAFLGTYYSPRQRFRRWWRTLLRGPQIVGSPLPALPPTRTILRGPAPAASRPPPPRGMSSGTAPPVKRPVRGSSPGTRQHQAAPAATKPKQLRGPSSTECVVSALSYLLPLATSLRYAAPVMTAHPELASVCAPLAMLTGPLSSPMASSLAACWLLCGVMDRRTVSSYFVRYNFYQAVLVLSFVLLINQGFVIRALVGLMPVHYGVFQQFATWTGLGNFFAAQAASIPICHVAARRSVQLFVASWSLTFSILVWVWSSWCCLLGRFPDRIPIVSSIVNSQVRW